MTYTTEQRDRFIAAISDGPIHFSDARDKAGLPDKIAMDIFIAGYQAKRIEIVDLGPGERGVLQWVRA